MSYASVFMSGGSQAVRIPAMFRFDSDRVSVEAYGGGLLLKPCRSKATWKAFFDACNEYVVENGELEIDRPDNNVAHFSRVAGLKIVNWVDSTC